MGEISVLTTPIPHRYHENKDAYVLTYWFHVARISYKIGAAFMPFILMDAAFIFIMMGSYRKGE